MSHRFTLDLADVGRQRGVRARVTTTVIPANAGIQSDDLYRYALALELQGEMPPDAKRTSAALAVVLSGVPDTLDSRFRGNDVGEGRRRQGVTLGRSRATA